MADHHCRLIGVRLDSGYGGCRPTSSGQWPWRPPKFIRHPNRPPGLQRQTKRSLFRLVMESFRKTLSFRSQNASTVPASNLKRSLSGIRKAWLVNRGLQQMPGLQAKENNRVELHSTMFLPTYQVPVSEKTHGARLFKVFS